MHCAGVAELVDAPDLGSGIFGCGGSSPFTRTTYLKAQARKRATPAKSKNLKAKI